MRGLRAESTPSRAEEGGRLEAEAGILRVAERGADVAHAVWVALQCAPTHPRAPPARARGHLAKWTARAPKQASWSADRDARPSRSDVMSHASRICWCCHTVAAALPHRVVGLGGGPRKKGPGHGDSVAATCWPCAAFCGADDRADAVDDAEPGGGLVDGCRARDEDAVIHQAHVRGLPHRCARLRTRHSPSTDAIRVRFFQTVKRRGVLFVYCDRNPKHKQRQG